MPKRLPKLENVDAKRTKELERLFFPQGPGPTPRFQQAEEQTTHDYAMPIETSHGGVLDTTMPLLPSGQAGQQHGQACAAKHRKKAGSSPNRVRHINSAHFGFNPLNPFESVVDAAPAMRHLHPRSWQHLELVLPPGCKPEVLQGLKAELAHFLRTHTSLIGARVSCTPQCRPLACGLLPPLNPPSPPPYPSGTLSSRVGPDATSFSPDKASALAHARSQTAHAGLVAAQPQDGQRLPPLGTGLRAALPVEAAAAAAAAAASPPLQRPRTASSRPASDHKEATTAALTQAGMANAPLLPLLQQQLQQSPSQSPEPAGCAPQPGSGTTSSSSTKSSSNVAGCTAAAPVYLPPSTPAGGVNGPRTPLASIPGAVAADGQWQQPTVPACTLLQPAGIGSVGDWVARRGVSPSSSPPPPAGPTPGVPPLDTAAVAAAAAAARWGGRSYAGGVQGTSAGAAATARGGGFASPGYPVGLMAGYGAGVAAAGATLAGGVLPAGDTPGGPPVTLGALVSERQSVRRQTQLIAEWLEAAVARLWQQHAQQVAELGLRSMLAHSQGSPSTNGCAVGPVDQGTPHPLLPSSACSGPQGVWQGLQPAPAAHQHAGHAQALQGMWQGLTPRLPPRQEHGCGGRPLGAAAHVHGLLPHDGAWGVGGAANGGQGPEAVGPPQGLSPPHSPRALQHALSVLMGGSPEGPHTTGGKAPAEVVTEKEDLAARFASFVSGSMLAAQQGDKAMAEASQELWMELLQVVSAASTALVQHVGEGCWEEGALLSRLWNLHSMLITSGMHCAHNTAAHAALEAEQLRSQIKRLDPLIEWDKAAQQELVVQRAMLAEQGASLHLASAERDGLLRENDKIIAHYKKELRHMRHEQRRGQWRLAKKLKNTQDQLVLMQRDRQSLLDAVTATRTHAYDMVGMIHSVNQHFQRLQRNHGNLLETEGFSMAELFTIEDGLRNMAATANRVQEVNKEAEDQHFQVEEQVTAVAATDDFGDDEVDAIMAGGDPDNPQGSTQQEPSPEASQASADEEKAKEEEEEEEEGEEQKAVPKLSEKEQLEQQLAAAIVTAAKAEEALREQEVAAEAAQQAAIEAALAAAQEAVAAATPEQLASEAAIVSSSSRGSSAARARQSMRPSSRLQSKAVSVHDVGMQTLPNQATAQERQEEEARIQDLVRARERKLAERLMMDFGIEMDRELLQAKRVPSPTSSSRSPSPDLDDGRSPVGRARSYAEQTQLGRMHSDDEAGSPLSLRRAKTTVGNPSSPPKGPEPPSFLKLVVDRIQEKLEEMQAELMASESEESRPETPDAQAAQRLSDAVKDLKETQELLKESRSMNRELEAKLKEARWSALHARHLDAESGLSSPAELQGGGSADKRREKDKAPGKKAVEAMQPPKRANQRVGSFKEKARGRRTSPDGARPPRDAATPASTTEQPKPAESRAFVLGKDRVMEKKELLSGAARLEEALIKYAGIKPRTPDWLLKLIDGIYRGKMVSDETRAKMAPPQEPIPLADYLFQHLAGVYGTSSLVNQYAAQLVATIKVNLDTDTRVRVFYHFLMENRWPRKVLSVFLEGLKRLSEPARLPCCDFPADWSGAKKGGHPLADVRKCLWVADKVLMRRHTRTAYTFAAALAVQGEPIPEAELNQYFVAPGYYGQELQQMLEYERGRAEFRKIQSHVFLEALCDEYTRCETVFTEVLPGLHKKWDTNVDGFLTLEDVTQMMKHMAPMGMEEEQVAAETSAFWHEAYKLENAAVHQSMVMPQQSSTSLLEEASAAGIASKEPTMDMIGVEAFINAAQRNNYIRLYVRLHKTPPAKRRDAGSHTIELQARLLLRAYIQNHWKLHGDSLLLLFSSTAPSVETLLHQQVNNMLNAKDGARKAIALHGLFKMLIGRKLDSIVSQLPSENTGVLQVDESLPEELDRLTKAIKVLYGADALMADDLRQLAQKTWDPSNLQPTTGLMQHRMLGDMFRIYNSLRNPMRTLATRFVSAHPIVVAFCGKFRPHNMVRKYSKSMGASATAMLDVLANSRRRTSRSTLSQDDRDKEAALMEEIESSSSLADDQPSGNGAEPGSIMAPQPSSNGAGPGGSSAEPGGNIAKPVGALQPDQSGNCAKPGGILSPHPSGNGAEPGGNGAEPGGVLYTEHSMQEMLSSPEQEVQPEGLHQASREGSMAEEEPSFNLAKPGDSTGEIPEDQAGQHGSHQHSSILGGKGQNNTPEPAV